MKSSTRWWGSHITQLFTRKNRQQLSALSTNFISQPKIYYESSPQTFLCPVSALSLAEGHHQCHFQSKQMSHFRTVRIASALLSDRVFDNTLHDCHLHEWAPICLRFYAFCAQKWWQDHAKIVRCAQHNLHVFGLWAKTHAVMRRTCKLHIERTPWTESVR